MLVKDVCPVVRFGPFEADFSERILRKHERRIRIQAKPLALLEVLVSRSGQLVSREELRNALWPEDVFVDFDKNLSTAINKLRAVLNDSAVSPRYIETVPRCGYRFIGTVKAEAEDLENAAPSPPFETATTPEPSSWHRRIWLMEAIAVVLAGLAAAGVWFALSRSRITKKNTIVVADFANTTGDNVFDGTLKTALQISLRQSPSIDLLSDNQVDAVLRLMTRTPGTKLTPDVARDICVRAGDKAYVAGAIGSLGTEYVLQLKAVNCANGRTLAEDQVTAASRSQVVSVLGRAATDLRRQVGETLATVQRFDVPLDQATTASLDALRAYTLGQKAAHEQGAAQSLPYDQQAIEADPNFAMAYEAVGLHYFNLGEPTRAAEYLKKAFELRDHASERERLKIEAGYYSSVTGQLDKAAETYRETIVSYPRDIAAFNNLGIVLAEAGRYEEAAAITRQAIHFAPEEITLDENLTEYLLALQQFDQVRQIVSEEQTKKPDNYIFPSALYILGFFGSDARAMAQQEDWFAHRPNYENFGLALAADTAAYGGQLNKARRLTRQAVDSAVRSDTREGGAIWQAVAAQREAAFGFRAEGRASAMRALDLDRTSQGTEAEAALALALSGDTSRAESLAQDLRTRFPLDTQIQMLWLPTIEAQEDLDRKNSAAAIKALQAASWPEEMGIIAFAANASGSCLYPMFIRGQAYLAAGQGAAAAAEFQKILDHRGIVWNCWTGSLANLGLARARALEARTSTGADADAARVRALSAYRDFLDRWKEADPEIPVLKQARAEYVGLL
jgi:DNA-binding winged helix-turn-helix (wHTH) protein/tetratricopeptide (TPR) repeat protein